MMTDVFARGRRLLRFLLSKIRHAARALMARARSAQPDGDESSATAMATVEPPVQPTEAAGQGEADSTGRDPVKHGASRTARGPRDLKRRRAAKWRLECRKLRGVWQLESCRGTGRSREHRPVDTMPDDWLLFKLTGSSWTRGSRVKQASTGWYVVFVKQDWKPADPNAAAPEPTTLRDVVAYVINASNGSGVAFLTDAGSVGIGKPSLEMRTLGKLIEDRRARIGPLYGGHAPVLGAPREQWEQVREIVLVAERPVAGAVLPRGRHRRARLYPPPAGEELDLARALEPIRASRVSLRFYDHERELIDSFDLRWMPSLQAISVVNNGAGPLPGPEGHVPPVVEIEHGGSLRVNCVVPGSAAILACDKCNGITRVQLRPEAIDGPIRLHLEDGPYCCEVLQDIDLIFWALGMTSEPPADWCSTRLEVRREQFRADSADALYLRRTVPHRTDPPRFGPTWERARPVVRGGRADCIPLREFGDLEEMRNSHRDLTLNLFLRAGESVPVLVVPAAPPAHGLVGVAPPAVPEVTIPPPALARPSRPTGPAAPPPPPRLVRPWDISEFIQCHVTERGRLTEVRDLLAPLCQSATQPQRERVEELRRRLRVADPDPADVWFALIALESLADRKPPWLTDLTIPVVAMADYRAALRWLRGS